MSTMAQLVTEICRLRLLRGLEGLLARCGYARIAGVDEAGRGALAGPVVAAACIPDPAADLPGVDDSKQLLPAERERLAELIRGTAVAWAVAAVPAEDIDRSDILRSTRVAMRRAILALAPPPDCVVTDAVTLAGLGVPILPVVKGDAVCYAVACASILAKVERDRQMRELDRTYPGYGFAAHKGYGAEEHMAALTALGPSPVHRLTFRSVVPRLGEAAR